jgi:hypothetical protein
LKTHLGAFKTGILSQQLQNFLLFMLLVYMCMLLEHPMTKFNPLPLHLLSITSQKFITPQTTKQATLESVISRKTSLHARLILATRIKTCFNFSGIA